MSDNRQSLSDLGAIASGDCVIPRTSIDGDLDQGRQPVARRVRIVPAVHIDDEVLGRADID